MATLVISISSDLSNESVGSSIPRVILIGSISVEVPVVPEVGVTAVASPAGVLELDTHSSSEVGPSESSLPPVSVAPMVSPFLCSDDSELDTEIPERHVLPIPHDAMLTRWRSRVSSRSLSPTTSTLEIPTAPILPAPSTVVAPSSEFPLAPIVAPPGIPLRHSISGHSLSGHASPDTTVVDSSTPPRFVFPLLARTPRCSEACLHWRSALLSTMYPPTTSESSARDSSSESSTGPSRKRCRFRDSISPEDSVEEDIDTDMLVDIKADATAVGVAVDRDVEAGVDAGISIEFDVVVNVEDEFEDEVESNNRGTMEVGVDVVARIDIPNGMLMPDAVERLEQNMTITRSGMTPEAIEELVNRRVEEALAAYEATRAANALEAESQSQNGSNDDNGNGGNGNGGDGNGGDGNGGNGNPNENNRGARPVARECTYQDFMKCQPLNFKGTEGEKYQVKHATCTLLNSALTWWNSHKRTVGTEAAFSMSWRELIKLMAKVYCLRNEIQKMESELWNLTVKNNDLAAYT
ncbi:putative reverse transcriptase domain-containing protein [Tanacetum coccineum]